MHGAAYINGGTGAVVSRQSEVESGVVPAPPKRSESGGTNYLGARNLSRCRLLIACRCALWQP